MITDFRQGDDPIALAGGLTFEQLNFVGNAIYMEMGEETVAPLGHTPGDEHEGPGRLPATLSGFDTSKLTAADLITCADLHTI